VLSGKVYVSDGKAVKLMSDTASISGDSLNDNKVTETGSCNKSQQGNSKCAQ